MPWRWDAVVTSERRCWVRRFARIHDAREESRQRITSRKEVDRAIRLVLWVAHHRLSDQLHTAAHRLKGALRRLYTARLLPTVRDLCPCADLRFEEFEDPLFKGVPLRKEESS